VQEVAVLQSSSSEEDDILTGPTDHHAWNQRLSGRDTILSASSKPAAARISYFSHLEQEAQDAMLAKLAGNGKRRKKNVPGDIKTPRSKDSVAHMDDMEAFSKGMLKSVSKSFETLTSLAKNGSDINSSVLSPFSKNMKKRKSLYTMLSEEMAIKKMLAESDDSDAKLYTDCIRRIAQINEDIYALAATRLYSDFSFEYV
jgi:hypothetical protein